MQDASVKVLGGIKFINNILLLLKELIYNLEIAQMCMFCPSTHISDLVFVLTGKKKVN